MTLKTVFKKNILIFFLFLFLTSSSQHYDKKKVTNKDLTRPVITEEGKISALLCCLAQDLKEQKRERFPFYFTYPLISAERSFDKRDDMIEIIDALFKKSKKRKNDKLFIRKTPQVEKLTTTWDFQIDDVKIKVTGEKATVKCNLIFYAAYPETTDVEWKAPGRRTKANFTLLKKDNEWRISRIDKLFSFIEDVIVDQTSKRAKFDKRRNIDAAESKQRNILRKGGGER